MTSPVWYLYHCHENTNETCDHRSRPWRPEALREGGGTKASAFFFDGCARSLGEVDMERRRFHQAHRHPQVAPMAIKP